jgi:DMSO/TMAO reductase YedYZ molybdopterin-dependent catalytic subunit
VVLLFVFCARSVAIAPSQTPAPPPSPTPTQTPTLVQPASAAALVNARLVVAGDVEKPLSFSLTDLGSLPRKILKVKGEHDTTEQIYQGVFLTEILERAGVPQGKELRGPDMATRVIAEGTDGYRATFSLAELEGGVQDSDVLVADTLNGEPIGGKLGPLRLVVPHDKKSGRWVRMLRSITIAKTPQ